MEHLSTDFGTKLSELLTNDISLCEAGPIEECVVCAKKFGEDVVLGKNRDRNYAPSLKVVRELTSEGVELCYVVDQDTGWSEGMNSEGIGIVNSALMVKRDEKEKKIAKKTKKPSKDGIRIKEALSKKTLNEVVESLLNFEKGVKGHTIVSDGTTTKVIENTSKTEPTVTDTELTEPVIRTNHGIADPTSGYAPGDNRDSSEIRMKNAEQLVNGADVYEEMFPAFYNHQQERGPKYDIVRTQHYLWTSSQQLMNLNKKEMILYLVPDAVKFTGIENNLPNEYDAKISCNIRKYETTPIGKYQDYVTTSPEDKKSAIKKPIDITPDVSVKETLENYLTEEIETIFENSNVTKVIGIYPGRFQPAGAHHYKTYKWLDKQFDEAWVATSDKTDTTKSPLDFKEKNMIWKKHKVRNVVKVKNPYVCAELLDNYDPETTAVVYIFGEKDAGRLKTKKVDGTPGYYQSYKKNKNNLEPYKNHGYFIVAPHVSIKVLGKEVNGTYIRELLGSPEYDEMTKIKAFEELFGWYDEKIFKYLTKKFSTLFENEELFESFLYEYPKFENLVNEISTIALSGLSLVDDGPGSFFPGDVYEKESDARVKQLGYDLLDYVVGKHGLGRNMDYREWGKYAGPVPAVSFYPAGVTDETTANNQISIDKSKSAHDQWVEFIDGVAETSGYKLIDFVGSEASIRKDDKTGEENVDGNTLDVEDDENEDKIDKGVEGQAIKENKLLTEGGAAGHMSHPFDDKDLTFADLKEMIRRSLAGELNVEKEVTEKLDGQNLMFSWKDGKLVSARNQGHLKNAGAAAPDVSEFESIFSDRPENIRDAFVSAVKDLESAISSLSDAQKNKVFKEGERFMNIEVMTPATQNVIPQNVDMLVFHGTQAYDSAGKPVSEDSDGNDITGELKDSARMLSGMLKQINADVQSRYSLNAPIVVELPKSKTFGDSFAKYSAMLDKLKKEFKLKDNDKVMKYHDAWWRNLLNKQQSKLKEVFPSKVYEALIGRWAYNDKSNKITTIRMDLSEQPKLKDWVNKFEKEDIVKQFEANMWPFQFIFLKLGAEVLQNVKGFVAAGGSDDIAKALDAHTKTLKAKKISSVESPEKFKKDIAKLFKNLDRLTAIGGTKVIAPSEGIVFQYKGGTYKLTGTFAPINQIMGIMRF
jgi:hypothetical protein